MKLFNSSIYTLTFVGHADLYYSTSTYEHIVFWGEILNNTIKQVTHCMKLIVMLLYEMYYEWRTCIYIHIYITLL